jgi:hypothetical protein
LFEHDATATPLAGSGTDSAGRILFQARPEIKSDYDDAVRPIEDNVGTECQRDLQRFDGSAAYSIDNDNSGMIGSQ